MPTSFLHGVETIQIERGTRPIRGVRTAVVGLVGTAPTWEVDAEYRTVNKPVLITSPADAARYFGTPRAGYTIPQALDAIFDQGNGIAVVVNVFDPATDTVAVVATEFTFTGEDRIELPHPGLSTVVVKSEDLATTYVAGDDYTVDLVTGEVLRVDGGDIAASATVSITYNRADPTAVVAADVIGSVTDGSRTGLLALQDSATLFGFAPKILVAPVFCTQASVVEQLVVQAEALRAIAIVDAPIGTTVAEAIAGRGAAGDINFSSASERVILCYPHLRVYDAETDSEVLEPYSQRLAGVIAARDVAQGYWWSPSNAEIRGVVGIEVPITASISDPTSEANQLNEAGIVTVFHGFGTGYRTWGNRSAAYPSVTHPRNFVAVRRTADILHDAIEQAMLQFLDQPITDALVDAITESVNAFIRGRIGAGALIDGGCAFDPSKNPPEEIAAGHLTFDLTFMPPAPAERISFESFIDIQLLRSVGAQVA